MISRDRNGSRIKPLIKTSTSESALSDADSTVVTKTPKAIGKVSISWTLVNFWLDTAMLVVFLALVWVATIVRFVFPAATSAAGWQLWGMVLDEWMGVQFALLATLTFGIVVHLMLHWSWVCGVFFTKLRKRERSKLPDDGIRTIYGVGLMIVILNLMGLLVAASALTVQSPM